MFKYILTGNGNKAIPIHSDMNINEFNDYITERSVKFHKDGTDKFFNLGMMVFINPQVFMVNDFMNHCPYLIGLK